MTRLFTSNFETGDATEWTVEGGSGVTTSQKRHGTYAGNDNGNTTFRSVWSSSATEFYAGFGVYWTGSLGQRRFATFNSSGTTVQCSLAIDASGHIRAGRGDLYQFGGGTELGVGTAVLSPSTWYFIEVHIKIDATGGIFQVKVDGTTDINLSSQNTKGDSGSTTCGRWDLGSDGFSQQHYWDDCYVNDRYGGFETTAFDGSTIGTYLAEVGADSPVALWLLDEASGNWADQTGNGHTATVSEPGTAATYGVTGPINGHTAVKFNGGTYARIATATALHVSASGAPWSLEGWVKGDSSQSDFGSPALLTVEYTGSYVDFLLGFWTGSGTDNQGSVNYYRGAWENLHPTGYGLSDDTWHHLVGTFDGTYLAFYLDGILIGGPYQPGAAYGSPTSNDLLIGCRWDSSATRLTHMAVAGLAIYDTALSPVRVAHHAAAGPNAGANTAKTIAVTSTITAALTAAKANKQTVAVTSTITAALTRYKSVSQAIAASVTLTVGMTRNKTKQAFIAATSTLTAALKRLTKKSIPATSTITPVLAEVENVAVRGDIVSTLPMVKQRARAVGSGTGYVTPTWSIDLHSPIIGATFAGLRVSWTADGPGAIEVDLRPTDINDNWTPGAHTVQVNFGGPVFAGYIERLEQSGPPADIRYTASGVGLASRLDYRIVRHEFEMRDNVDVIVSNLLDEAQTQFNGDMGFSMGTVQGTTANRLRSYCFGVKIGDAIRELAQIGNGFDWEVDANSQLNIWQNTRGVHTGKTLQISDTNDWAVTADTGDVLTNVSAIGSQEQPFGPIHRLSYSPGLSNVYGRREEAIDVDSTEESDLFDSADQELSTRAGAKMQLTTMWIDERGPWPFGDVWLQDIVSVVLPTYFGGTQDMRCTEIDVSLEPGVHYFVTHTFEALCVDITQAQDDGP